MKKQIFSILIISLVFSGCTEEEQTQTIEKLSSTIETKLTEIGLDEEAKQMATDSLNKIKEAYVDEQKIMMDNAYKMSNEYIKLIAEKAKSTFEEIEATNTTN
jgi:PBP1b-binding outer membrane lipoprotein LpoB